ncbi:serine/threonine-protein kinase [Chondromyces crocatus]|uniref:Protein kinase domain-containing protein n=1 Tax=Chondromyces crocatus TaxID=52 RepID=A0A0K1EET8_CHOCO|nr:serine/threonine-protein kinase [Chondromyces crocatus]AKT39390.1 uncharacterized protein CMC5_035370 [Chondromyces crocatus]
MQPGPAKSCPSCGDRYDADVLYCPRDGTPLHTSRKVAPVTETDPYAGLELAGQIRLQHLIGIGSMGRVYRAFQAGIERDVAVKILHREMSGNAELTGRFHREAKIASRLVHPNVVQVLMSGTIPPCAVPHVGGELYLVMEHLDGLSLLSALAAAGTGGDENALPLPRALHIILQVCDAVGEAHAQGIVHRDLKPENIMLVRRGEDPDFVKVLDFGIARFDWADKAVATQAGLIFGTAKYISPEGAEGQSVGPAADVYSIATMLYQCLAGRAPFEGDSPVALLVQHTHAPPPDLRSITRASYVPTPIAQVIMQNLAKRPGERARDARALRHEFALAARASGLDPEEIQAPARMTRTSGLVKLASKARTRALELSPELAARLGAADAPALESGREEDAAGLSARSHAEALEAMPVADMAAEPCGVAAETPLPARRSLLDGNALPGAARHEVGEHRARTSQGHDAEGRHPGASTMGADLSGPELEPPSTMHGVASEAHPRPRRAKLARAVAIAACCGLVGLVLVLGGQHLGALAPQSPNSIEAHLERARECMRRHAWDAPQGENVKEITERAQSRWPTDGRVRELRREAAERLVATALGRKYAGDLPGAIRLVRLALELAPEFTTAQHLAAELESGKAPGGKETTALVPAPPGRGGGPATARGGAPSSAPGAPQRAIPRAPDAQPLQPTPPPPPASTLPTPQPLQSPELPPSAPTFSPDPASLPPTSAPWL